MRAWRTLSEMLHLRSIHPDHVQANGCEFACLLFLHTRGRPTHDKVDIVVIIEEVDNHVHGCESEQDKEHDEND